jgi:hypothetical protein
LPPSSSDWLDTDEINPFPNPKLASPTFSSGPDGESAAEVKKSFAVAMEKAEQHASKPEEPSGRRGRLSEVLPLASPKKRKSVGGAAGARWV